MEYTELLQKFAVGTATEQDKQAFNDWLEGLSPDRYVRVLDEYAAIMAQTKNVKESYDQEWLDELLQKIRMRANTPADVVLMYGRRKFRWWAAASVVLLLGVGSYFFIVNKNKKSDNITQVSELAQAIKAPATNRATITLSGGQKVFLDSVGKGTIATQNNTSIVKTSDDAISYQQLINKPTNETQYNTLINPRGSKVIAISLADGSRVWLNAASTISYPVAFSGNERTVSINGEAYFEITHDASRPFHVKKGNLDIKVLGTHFNVDAYDDEDAIRVTLLEGSVKVTNKNDSALLVPGGQAVARGQSKMQIDQQVDVQEVIAWQKGLFEFRNATLPVIMRQVGRWYDLEIDYRGGITEKRFGGGISRDLSLDRVLAMLGANGIKFELEGRKLIVEQEKIK